jgi:hypothetical protein
MGLRSSILGSLLLIGCGGPTDIERAAAAVCGPSGSADVDRAVFQALTSVDWANSACASTAPLAPTCHRLELRADGSYAWTAISDYTERDDAGTWNFRARSDRDGLVCLSDGSVMNFRVEDGSMTFGPFVFAAGAALTDSGDRDALPHVRASDLYMSLSERAWIKTNHFDLLARPDAFSLRRDGTLWASYRAGSCEHGGVWSLDHGDIADAGSATLTEITDPHTCDARREPTTAIVGAWNDRPVIDDGVLMRAAGDTYADEETARAQELFAFTSYGRGVSLLSRGTFHGTLQAGTETVIDLAIENESDRAHQLGRVQVSVQPLTAELSTSGDPIVLAERDYTGTELLPGQVYADTLAVTPPAAGLHLFQVIVESTNERQSWRNRGSYLVELE